MDNFDLLLIAEIFSCYLIHLKLYRLYEDLITVSSTHENSEQLNKNRNGKVKIITTMLHGVVSHA